MSRVAIDDRGCRGCELCIDECPCGVFEAKPVGDGRRVRAVRPQDCMGCFSCFHLCPSQCIQIEDVELQRPFHRFDENVNLVERFLQGDAAATPALTVEDWQKALQDVSSTLLSLVDAIAENVGRATTAVGRQAGRAAASHLPETRDAQATFEILEGLREWFRDCFVFQYELSGRDIQLTFSDCVIGSIVGEQVGEALLCHMFHDYLAGLLGAYFGGRYRHEFGVAGTLCKIQFFGFQQ